MEQAGCSVVVLQCAADCMLWYAQILRSDAGVIVNWAGCGWRASCSQHSLRVKSAYTRQRNLDRREHMGRPELRWECTVKMLKEAGFDGAYWILLAQKRGRFGRGRGGGLHSFALHENRRTS